MTKQIACGLLAAAFLASITAQTTTDSLERGFDNPPDSAKPRVWWHWMNGNITKEGIKKDLEWMKRTGIGGFQNFDAALATPQIVEKRLVYMTPEWKDAFRYTTTLADQLGLEMAIAGSPGWSESGGPWVPPAQAMKKLVWSETPVAGGQPLHLTLPKPPTVPGPFQSIPRPGATAQFYADSAVIAFRLPDNDQPTKPTISTSEGTPTSLKLAPTGQKAWIQFEYPQPQSIRAITLVLLNIPRRAPSNQEFESSADGQHFRTVIAIPNGKSPSNTLSFPAATAKFFRVTFRTLPPAPTEPPPPANHQIGELTLHPDLRINHFEEKAGFGVNNDFYTIPTPQCDAGDVVRKTAIVNLTGKMQPDGTLDWTPPAGRWMIQRFGYSLTGITNHPASPEATGLEVDKLNRTYVKNYLDKYLDQYKDTVGPLMGKRGLQYVITDSWEAGVENWTDDMVAEFAKRRGYDPRPWLPVLTGRIVESADASERFLFDFRATIADLTAEYHYDQITASLHARGMGRYSESHESGRAFIADGMEVKRSADIPMSALWVQSPGVYREAYGYNADIRESASVAHIYGQNLVAAESMTAGAYQWAWSPETLKPIADKELAMGLNRFVIHCSVHQPVDDKVPGLGLGKYGQWFTRHETWAEMAKPWITYLARNSYLLQQGKFVADILYFYGEDSNLTALYGAKPPDIPAGYNFDYTNADALIHKLSVANGRIITPSGMSYLVLVLDPRAARMTLPVLRKIQALVAAGATVAGPRPTATPSLSDNQDEFQAIAQKLRIYPTIAEALTNLHVEPDFKSDGNILFVHRTLPDGEIYWIDNRSAATAALDGTFRVSRKAAELWHAETGRREPASYRIENGHTTVPLRLAAYESVFVVFRKPAAKPSRAVSAQIETRADTVKGAWDIAFQPNRGAPAKATLDTLASWSDNSDKGVKYFSGTATYSKSIDVPATLFKAGARTYLDLGEVKNLAEVVVNGQSLGIVWKAPFRVEVTSVLKPGPNRVEIKVANLWVNRLIGDLQPDAAVKYTYTTQPFYQANSQLLPSGLLGPVRLVRTETE
jgi:hypothetical protein